MILVLAFCTCFAFACEKKSSSGRIYSNGNKAVARFMSNLSGEEISLDSGRTAISENSLYASYSIKVGEPFAAPETNPSRQGYNFAGWAVDRAGTSLWNFSNAAQGSVTLYAKWTRDEGVSTDPYADYVDPTITFEEKIDDSTAFNLKGVCNVWVKNDVVGLTTAALNLLAGTASNVKSLLNYTRASSTTITSCVYADSTITVSYTDANGPQVKSIAVNDVTSTLKVKNDNASGTYETKAKNYESSVSIEPYKVVMAGSSSMENWKTSVADMNPLPTVNVGIGGTTAEQWTDGLAQRLIFPYNPRTVVFYVGINNIINSKQTGKKTGENLVALFNYVHEHLPDTEIHYILMNKVPGYTYYHSSIEIANNAVKTYASTHSFLKLIDAGKDLVKKNGEMSAAYFLNDGLHMSLAGYVLWGAEVKKCVITREKERYDD